MSVDGAWKLTINSPMGPQPTTLVLAVEGDTLTGSQSAQGNTSAIANGKINGDTLTWSNSITSPFPMTLEFTGKVDGDALAGTVKAGSFGSFPFSGGRA